MHVYESIQVRPPLRCHELFFLFDLAAGSLTLEMIREYTLAEAAYGKKRAEIYEARKQIQRSERNKKGLVEP